jgi:hypothetical protein
MEYDIRVRGSLEGSHWTRWFEGMRVSPQADGTTVISGPVVDQSALHGLLARIRDLGLVLIAVQRLESEYQSTGE